MTDIQSAPVHDGPAPRQLVIPAKVAASLPQSVRDQLATMPEAEQAEFLKAFERKSASLAMAYLSSLIYCHYGLLGRWAMSGWMWLSLFVASALGMIWWLIDLMRMPRMVREHNHQVAADILQKLRIAATGPSPLAGS
jgi:hypothetical protein